MSQQSFKEVLNNRKEMFKDLVVDQVFEPFIGTAYASKGHKRILFVAYDEWAYYDKVLNLKEPYLKRPKAIPNEHAIQINIRQLFRASSYHDNIKKVFDIMNCGLSVEDVAFYNFVVDTIPYPTLKTNKQTKSQQKKFDGAKYIEVFKHVISFTNPDLVIFCNRRDKNSIGNVFNDFGLNLDTYLHQQGIFWLDDANLDYDIRDSQNESVWFYKCRNLERVLLRMTEASEFANEIEDDPCDYDDAKLDMQHVPLDDDEIIAEIPQELQRFAAFIKDELEWPGGFMLHRYKYVIRIMLRNCCNGLSALMDEITEISNKEKDVIGFYTQNPLCTEVRENIYDTTKMLKFLSSHIKALVEPPASRKNVYCGIYTSKRQRTASTERTFKRNATNRSNISKELLDLIKDEIRNDFKEEKYKVRALKRKEYYQALKADAEKKDKGKEAQINRILELQSKETLSRAEQKELQKLKYKYGPTKMFTELQDRLLNQESNIRMEKIRKKRNKADLSPNNKKKK